MIAKYDKKIVIIGGGPAGLSAAIAAYDSGEEDILIIERDSKLGGILNQCIHNGFVLALFKEELTGPEYASRLIKQGNERGIPYLLSTTVTEVSADKTVYCVSEKGVAQIKANAIIMTCGCRERPRGAIGIAGARCSGIYTAGTAQKLINIMGYMPGKECVILGSGDIGLIMARRMTLQGAKVKAVLEIMPTVSGLPRNVVQCLNDFNIPLMTSHTVTDIRNINGRVSGITVSKVDEHLRPISGSEFNIDCDTLLLSVGLTPETELARSAGTKLSNITGGAVVDDTLMTDSDGIFMAGNMLHVHDLADYACMESALAGKNAAEYIKGRLDKAKNVIPVICDKGIRYTVPALISPNGKGAITFTGRPCISAPGGEIKIIADGKTVYTKKELGIRPACMLKFNLSDEVSQILRSAKDIHICLEGNK